MPQPPYRSLCCSADEVQIQSRSPKPLSIAKDKSDSQYDRLEKLLLKVIEDVNRNMCDVKRVVEASIQGFDQTLQTQINRLVEIELLRQEQSMQQVNSPRAKRSSSGGAFRAPVHSTASQASSSAAEGRGAPAHHHFHNSGSRDSLEVDQRESGVCGEVDQRESGVCGEEVPDPMNFLFEAVMRSNTSLVMSLLQGESDPNATVSEYWLEPEAPSVRKIYKPCSLLGVAVLGQDYKMAELLIMSRANPDSVLGFSAGPQQREWSAPCSHTVVTTQNSDLLDLLVCSRADPHATSTSGSNLLWQCSYLGNSDMLGYLLNLGVSPELPAEHPEMVGVSHRSLHIATIRGHHIIVARLLAAKARHETKNEIGMSPLDDAILLCRPIIVSLLVAEGADLFAYGGEGKLKRGNSKQLIRRGRYHASSSQHESMLRPLDRVFLLENPVVMSAVAEGLGNQETQMQRLTISELVRFLGTPGDTPEKILKALFRERMLSYWEQVDAQMVRKDITTALIPKPRVLPSGALVENMNVAALPVAYSDFTAKMIAKAPLSSMTMESLLKLAPQQHPIGCFKEEYLMTSVSLYESLIQDVHDDLLVIATISKLHHVMLGYKPAQAMLQHCWTKVINLQIFDVFVHLFLMLDFIVISIILQHPKLDFGLDRDFFIRVVACLGLICAAMHFVNEVLQCVAFHVQGWLCDYMRDAGNYGDIIRIGGDVAVLSFFLLRGLHAADTDGFRVIFAFVCFYQWIKLLSSLTPFRDVGTHLLPILEAMRGVGAFFVVLMFYVMGLWHSYITLEPGRIWSFDVWYMVYRIALIGDYNPYVFSDQHPDGSYYIVRIFYMLVALLVTITLMNVFIAALGNEFTAASDNIETIFEHHRSNFILSHMAVRAGIKRMMPTFWTSSRRRLEETAGPQETLWFCLAARDRSQ